jgi:lipopolysaccharide export LptBFGC system permease protein LptF
VWFGLILRTVFWDLVKTTALALVAISALFMMVGAMVEAARNGLDPFQIMILMPYLIPPTLPYTLPTCLLFACAVVYGSLSSFNEIVALKAGGISVARVFYPAVVLSVGVSALGLCLADRFIPASNRKVTEMILSDLKSMAYAYLKQKGSIAETEFPYEVVVQGVRDERLIRPIFKQRGGKGTPDLVIQAEEAELRVVQGDDDRAEPQLVLHLYDGVATYGDNVVHFRERPERMPIPKSLSRDKQDKSDGLSFRGLRHRAQQRGREASRIEGEFGLDSSLFVLKGDLVSVPKLIDVRAQEAQRYRRKQRESWAEIHLRVAQSLAAIPFVLLGCPVSLLLRRRDFLHVFFACFLPITTIYYPAMILSFNVYKEGHGPLIPTLWAPSMVMALLSIGLLRRVCRY